MHTGALTWAALLGRWIEFARSAVALPDDAAGRAWRKSIPAIIALQAVTMALAELDDLAADERALGLDRAEILIHRHTAELREAFANAPLHPMLTELIADANAALRNASIR